MPARLNDLQDALVHYGVSIEKPGSGSHWKARRVGERVYTIPAHNGLRTEVDDRYIKALCRNFGIDPSEFFARLRGNPSRVTAPIVVPAETAPESPDPAAGEKS